jgi:uncharacterized protein
VWAISGRNAQSDDAPRLNEVAFAPDEAHATTPRKVVRMHPAASPTAPVHRFHLTTLQSMHPLIETHRTALLALAHRRGVTGVRVFGSMSRGDGTDSSDVDLLVTLPPGTSALALGGLLLDAQELLGRRVDVVTEASLHPALRERVMAGAVPM